MTKSKIFLLDCNVLIALSTPEHSLNARAAAWFREGHRFATCPVTQGALIRFHLRAGVDATPESAKELLHAVSALSRHEFWPDDASYLDMPTSRIVGHRQVTDAYLVLLAERHRGSLVTLDSGLAAIHRGVTLIGQAH
jgi:toxin-antitoxin system PIN domain toxin